MGVITLPKETIRLFILDNICNLSVRAWFHLLEITDGLILINKVRPVYFWDFFLAARYLIKILSKRRNNI